MIVAVKGRAGAQRPIVTDMTSTAAVIAELLEEQSVKIKNERGEWTSETQITQQQRWEAAWYLVNCPAPRWTAVEGGMLMTRRTTAP